MSPKTNEDIVQEALVVIYDKYKHTEFENGILPYAYGVMDNLLRNDYKTETRRNNILSDQITRLLEIYGNHHSIEDMINYQELVDEIWEALTKLSNKEKAVFKLWLEGIPILEIQKRLDLRRNTVAVRLFRAIKKLKHILKRRGFL